jgi:hypothetical protein
MQIRIKIYPVVRLFFQWFQVFAAALKLAKTETRLSQGFSVRNQGLSIACLGQTKRAIAHAKGLMGERARDGNPLTQLGGLEMFDSMHLDFGHFGVLKRGEG